MASSLCPSGYKEFENQCYKVYTTPVNFDEAANNCYRSALWSDTFYFYFLFLFIDTFLNIFLKTFLIFTVRKYSYFVLKHKNSATNSNETPHLFHISAIFPIHSMLVEFFFFIIKDII